MAMFDPKKHQDPDDNGGGGNYLTTADDYLLACTGFARAKSRTGKPYLKCRFRVIHGPMKDKTLAQNIFLNEESLWKLGRWTAAMDYSEPFDLDSDKDVREALCFRPFLGRVSIRSETSQDGVRKYADIEMFLARLTDDQVEVINQWTADNEAKREATGGGAFSDPETGDPGVQDDDIPFARNTTEHGDTYRRAGPKRWPL